jgi:hypothetical protein
MRLADDLQDASRELLGKILPTSAYLQDCKLIATYAPNKVAGSQARRQAMGHAP